MFYTGGVQNASSLLNTILMVVLLVWLGSLIWYYVNDWIREVINEELEKHKRKEATKEEEK